MANTVEVGEPDGHWDEVDRLWRAIKRDFFASIEGIAGFGSSFHPRVYRMMRNWDTLCQLDIDVAAKLWHGLSEIEMVFSKVGDEGGPSRREDARMREIIGLAEIGRAANPDSGTLTLREIVALGEEALREDIDRDLRDGM